MGDSTSWAELLYYEVDEPPEVSTDMIFETMKTDSPRLNRRNYTMPEYMAAEIIQLAYKRYRAYKTATRMKRISSVEQIVLTMAANTIKNTFKNCQIRRKRIGKLRKEQIEYSNATFDFVEELPLSAPRLTRKSAPAGSFNSHFIEVTEISCTNLRYILLKLF